MGVILLFKKILLLFIMFFDDSFELLLVQDLNDLIKELGRLHQVLVNDPIANEALRIVFDQCLCNLFLGISHSDLHRLRRFGTPLLQSGLQLGYRGWE